MAYKTLSLSPPAPRGKGDEYMEGFGLMALLLKHITPVPRLSRVVVMTPGIWRLVTIGHI